MPTTIQSPPTRTASDHGGPTDRRRLVIWLWSLATIALIATAVAIGYATGVIGEVAADDTPTTDEPTDDAPADEPLNEVPDDEPLNEVPADEPGDDGPADEVPNDEIPAAPVRYDEELRANWDVTGVAADDVLNVRDAPGVDGAIMATLTHDTAELESTGRIAYVGDALWREIVVPGDGVGWVNAAYLTETA